MNIIRKARGTEIPKQAQRVFLSYDGHNNEDRDSIISDLLSMDAGMDCVVSYLENPDIIDEEQLQNELSGTQLLVIWVTLEMLQVYSSVKLPVEYSIAREINIPILPILNDDGLFSLYAERFGSIHCIAKLDSEYRIKLKAQMEMFLASEDIIRQINEKAFTSSVFVSYRKHELSEARRFMKAFHDLEDFESIAIRYDNFLTAGRDFDKDIEEAIVNSNALVLVVTPDMATEGNYVQKKEYPFAREVGKPIISVEVIPTPQNQFSKLFPHAECSIPLDDTNSLQATFCNALGASSFAKCLDSEHAYLLGMAYFKGINVERDFDRAVRLLSTATEDNTTASIDAANQLARIYKDGMWANIDYAQALRWLRKALPICEEVQGNDHPDTADIYNNIAFVHEIMGEYPEALEKYWKALAIREKALGKDHPDITITYNNIAEVYYRQGEYSKALEWLEKALAIDEKALGKEHPSVAPNYNNIAEVYHSQGEYAKALEWYKKALSIYEKMLGKEHPETATTYNNIALVYKNQGEYTKALDYYQKALAAYEKVLGKEHPWTATTYHNIASVYNKQGKYTKALEEYKKSLVICEKLLGKEHPDTAATYNNIANTCNNQGKYTEALEWYEKALAICEKVLGNDHPHTIATYNNISEVYYNMEEYTKTLEYCNKALAIRGKVPGKEHPHTATTYNNIALVYTSQGEYQKALESYEKALSISEKVLGKEHPKTAIIYNNIAGVYAEQEEYTKALEWYQKALSIREEILGEEHPDTITTYNNIANVYKRQKT